MPGAVGITLPWLTLIQPRLTPATALCVVALQALAKAFHASRREIVSFEGVSPQR